jgi:DnaJ-class molecular chaperone
MKNPYDILGVSPKASDDDIQKAYRALAKKHHPDLHPEDKDAEERFKEVSAAYSLLSDSEKRAQFDRGEIDASGAEQRERSFYRAYADGSDGGKYSPFGSAGDGGFSAEDIFAEVFGQHGQGEGRARFRMQGADVTYSLRCPFLDAVNGATTRINLPDGKSLDVAIPKGTRDRQTLRLKGQGMPGIGGGPAGDAYVEIHIEPHAFFERKDDNIHIEVPVTLSEAVLGGKIRVPTIDGHVSLTIPPGSNTGTNLRLRGKGVFSAKDGARGDQYVILTVVLPDEVDQDLKEFLESWSPSRPYDVRARAGMD